VEEMARKEQKRGRERPGYQRDKIHGRTVHREKLPDYEMAARAGGKA
jgi:chloramphenicol 3-O-phosphotransferase